MYNRASCPVIPARRLHKTHQEVACMVKKSGFTLIELLVVIAIM
ncbi:MAG: type II secretion system protein [Armatimonadetes bacterium]|nr:type II secretion system protein [Armatimonadota bacterium]